MPRLTTAVPSYRRHKASGQAVVTLDGRDHYIGVWNSTESKLLYQRLVREWVTAGRVDPSAVPNTIAVSELLLARRAALSDLQRGPARGLLH